MLRNIEILEWRWGKFEILNEVLSLNAQESGRVGAAAMVAGFSSMKS